MSRKPQKGKESPLLGHTVIMAMATAMAQATLAAGASQYDTSLALRAKVLSLYSLDTNTDAVSGQHSSTSEPLSSTAVQR